MQWSIGFEEIRLKIVIKERAAESRNGLSNREDGNSFRLGKKHMVIVSTFTVTVSKIWEDN